MQAVIEMKVRDYECDIQGIVNNSVYQNYIEHARHEFMLEGGVSFSELAANHINLVVVRAELDYKLPLRSGDVFQVHTQLSKLSRIRYQFDQTISSKGAPCLQAKVIITAMNDEGRPVACSDLSPLCVDLV